MADLDAQVTLNGVLLETDGRELMAVGTSGRSWRRRTAEGPYMHGRVLLGAVLEMETLTVIFRGYGASYTAAMNRAQEVLAVVDDLAFTAVVTIEGRTSTYRCETADFTMVSGDTIDKYRAMAHMVEYQLTIPIQPGVI